MLPFSRSWIYPMPILLRPLRRGSKRVVVCVYACVCVFVSVRLYLCVRTSERLCERVRVSAGCVVLICNTHTHTHTQRQTHTHRHRHIPPRASTHAAKAAIELASDISSFWKRGACPMLSYACACACICLYACGCVDV